MSYTLVLGDQGPPMELSIAGKGFELLDTDTCKLHYKGSDGVSRVKALTIVDAAAGALAVPYWTGSELPVAGIYSCRVKVERAGDNTFPRTFPNDGTAITFPVFGPL